MACSTVPYPFYPNLDVVAPTESNLSEGRGDAEVAAEGDKVLPGGEVPEADVAAVVQGRLARGCDGQPGDKASSNSIIFLRSK